MREIEEQMLLDEVAAEAKRIIRRAVELCDDEDYTFIVVAINNREKIAAGASNHSCVQSMTVAEAEQAYRQFAIAEHIVGETLDKLETVLPDHIVQKYQPGNEPEPVKREFKN